MLEGCYYRCPIPIEKGDTDHPRFFVLAQLKKYNELSDAAKVTIHDLLGSRKYYNDILKYNIFHAPMMSRCAAIPGGLVQGAWGFGTIVYRMEPALDDQPYFYYIRCEDGKFAKACETELRIEYSQMDYSPIKQLRAYEFQHHTWFLNRMKVSRTLHLINNSVYGFKVLAGCRALLLPHQISTVARCFETLPIRYMLADEVGLGKTVEACSILKILVSEDNRFRVLIVVPGSLMSQWQSELKYKYSLNADLSSKKSNICIIPMEELNLAKDILSISWDMAIVDETHRLLGQKVWYEHIQALSRQVRHLLLISATPIQDRNEEYHRLLVLLNPDQYEYMAPERFSLLVNKQKSIQQIVNQQLGRLDRYDEYGEIIIDKLQSISDILEDDALKKLVNSINIYSEDCGKDIVTQALSYICENYRVERRVIRNRRQLISEEMASRTLQELPYVPLSANEAYNEIGAIQGTLAYLSDNCDGTEDYIANIAIPLLGSVFSSPWAFEEMLNKLGITDMGLNESVTSWKGQAQHEHDLANQALDEDPDLIKGRLLWALNYLDQETDVLTDEECKIVVFTGYNATLREFLKLFNSRFEVQGIRAVAFGSHMARKDLEDSVYDFQNDPGCRVIICDETGGEGRNFQNAVLLMHLDMPWSANALEQRIGRLDRLGRDPNIDVLSVVLYTQDSVEEQLFHIWKDGMKLFEQSLSGLEIITGELNRLIVDALLDNFYNGLTNAFDSILNQAEEMRESVEDEQQFDIGATLYRPLSRGIDHVLKLYTVQNDNLFAQAMLSWSGQAGLEAERPTSDGLIEFKESRFSSMAAMQSLFVPPDWTVYNGTSIMHRENKILGSFDRKVAALREDVLFFAPGDVVYDAIINNAVGCSRGRCAALHIRGSFNYDGLVFIYNVESNLSTLLADGISPQILSQFRMFLPLEQIIVPIALTQESRQIEDIDVIKTLCSANERNVEHLGRRSRTRLTSSPLDRFIAQFPPNTWDPLVDKCSEQAYKRAVEQMKEQSDIEAAEREMKRIINGYIAECMYFERDNAIVEQKLKSYRIALRAIKEAKPILDSACFMRVRSHE